MEKASKPAANARPSGEKQERSSMSEEREKWVGRRGISQRYRPVDVLASKG